MFICPTCSEEFRTEDGIKKHFLQCWKEKHPFHQSKSAPYGGKTTVREVSNDITNFFNSLR